jgi:acyl-CoA reductase-like NAD-dependent aldehyde dehydrogenase
MTDVNGPSGLVAAVDVSAAATQARCAQKAWAQRPVRERAALLHRLRRGVLRTGDELVEVLVDELGKLPAEARVLDVAPAALALLWAAQSGPLALAPSTIPTSVPGFVRTATSTWKPRGVCALLSPWNYPAAIPMGTIAAALIGGNAVLWKPSEHAAKSSAVLVSLLERHGLPHGLVSLVVGGPDVGRAVVDADVDHVTFVGSSAVGRKVAARCGERLIPCIIEGGGKAPAIVLPGADLERAAHAIVFGGLANGGQSCVAVERVYAVGTTFEPLQRRLRTLAEHVELPRAVLGDRKLPRVIDLSGEPESPLLREEVFGPCLPLVSVENAAEAALRSNAHPLQLAAYVFGPAAEARAVAAQLRAPMVAIDDAMIHYALPELPFGGVGASGFGRVHGDEGLRSLCVQQIVVEPGAVRPSREPWWQPYPGHKHVLRALDVALDVIDRLRR